MNIVRIAFGFGLAALTAAGSAHGATRKPYIVELTSAPVAAYTGTVSGLDATRPAPGTRLNVSSEDVLAYTAYLDSKQTLIASKVPAAKITYRYKNVLNGFAAWLTDDEFAKLAATAGVRSITVDSARKLDTSYTPTFLGINGPGGAWSMTDASGRKVKGENVILGHIDGGVWPENPSVSDKVDANGKPVASHLSGTVVYDPLPAGRYTGTCVSGEGFSPSMCNNKLVGAQYFNTTFKLAQQLGIIVINPLEYLDSPRDQDGHGTHTLTTAGGNENVDVILGGSPISNISGVAPRARLAAYKACWNNAADTGGSCFQSDTVAAIDKAVADGVDVINFSISGSQTSVRDIVETAFLNAALSGVFVAASAGNSGPGNAVAHNSPWMTTVGNSTHDRYTEAVVTLGSGATAQGASFQTSGLPASALIWSRDAGFGAPAPAGSTQAHCFGTADLGPALLDPAKVAGKILVCDRGGNVLVNKIASAKAAGAVGVIIQNRPQEGDVPASANTTPVLVYDLPTVHVPVAYFTAVTTEARRAGGTAAFAGSQLIPGVPAPVMNASSSRGPNRADPDVLKPDITAPGTDIIAAFANQSITPAQREQIIAGTLVPGPWADMISGTSMSSPHVAGAAALLRQANPTWSPFAIKSALMTSATQNVKLADGTPDLNRWGFGSGHLNPNGALATKVVYDSDFVEYIRYYNGQISGRALNLPSLTFANIVGSGTLTRKLTNRGTSTETFTGSASAPGFSVSLSPASLTLAPGETKSFSVRLARNGSPIGAYAFGEVVWTSAGGQSLRSPLTAKAESLVALSSVSDTRNVGTKVFTVATGYDGPFASAATGLVPATRLPGSVELDDQTCFGFKVPVGAKQLRLQMFNTETQGGAASDLDLSVYRGATLVGTSAGASSDELVSLSNPAAADYTACVEGYAPVNGEATFTLNLWVVGPTVTPATLRAAGPSTVYTGGVASVAMAWDVPAGARYLGVVEYRTPPGATVIGRTTVFIDNVAAKGVVSKMIVSRDKNVR